MWLRLNTTWCLTWGKSWSLKYLKTLSQTISTCSGLICRFSRTNCRGWNLTRKLTIGQECSLCIGKTTWGNTWCGWTSISLSCFSFFRKRGCYQLTTPSSSSSSTRSSTKLLFWNQKLVVRAGEYFWSGDPVMSLWASSTLPRDIWQNHI